MSLRLSCAVLLASVSAIRCGSSSPAQTVDLPSPAPPPSASVHADTSHDAARAIDLAFVAVDDDHDVLASLEVPSPTGTGSLPAGVKLLVQNAPAGRGKSQPVHYATITPVRGETIDKALARTRPFFDSVQVPAQHHFGFERLIEFNQDRDRFEVLGYQTILLSGPPAITEKDIDRATAHNDAANGEDARWTVALSFTTAGGGRFRQFTSSHIGFRVAIVLDGIVESAPIIMSEIGGGQAQITMGGAPDEQGRDANALAQALSSH